MLQQGSRKPITWGLKLLAKNRACGAPGPSLVKSGLVWSPEGGRVPNQLVFVADWGEIDRVKRCKAFNSSIDEVGVILIFRGAPKHLIPGRTRSGFIAMVGRTKTFNTRTAAVGVILGWQGAKCHVTNGLPRMG